MVGVIPASLIRFKPVLATDQQDNLIELIHRMDTLSAF